MNRASKKPHVLVVEDEDAFRDYALADDSGMSSFLTTPEQIDLQTMQPAEQNTLQKGSQKLLMTEKSLEHSQLFFIKMVAWLTIL